MHIERMVQYLSQLHDTDVTVVALSDRGFVEATLDGSEKSSELAPANRIIRNNGDVGVVFFHESWYNILHLFGGNRSWELHRVECCRNGRRF